MSVTFQFTNAKVYFSESVSGTSGTSYTKWKWYEGVSDSVTLSSASKVYLALANGTTIPTWNGDAESIYDLNSGEYFAVNSSGTNVSGSTVTTTVNNVKCIMCTSSSLIAIYFNGNNKATKTYTTTIDTQYVTYDDTTLSSSNCDVYYGSLTNKASGSGNSFTFNTPDGGGDTKVWFCKSGTTTPY